MIFTAAGPACAQSVPAAVGELPGHLGGPWLDDRGSRIQAHGAGILHHNGVFYWYGEDKGASTERRGLVGYRTPALGVRCYSSRDLRTWKDEGRVISTSDAEKTHDLHPENVIERPKVLFHRATGTFVLWFHFDRINYDFAGLGVAVSTSPTGPFQYIGSVRPGGDDSRDFTVFEHEGEAWLFHSAEWNKTMHIRRLTDDYRSVAPGPPVRVLVNESREAPAVFFAQEKFWMLSSGCTGWSPNEARLAVADSIAGPWTLLPNPCRGGTEPEVTWRAQSAFVLRLSGEAERHLALFDRWNNEDLGDSRYIWLPVTWEDGRPIVRWDDTFVPGR